MYYDKGYVNYVEKKESRSGKTFTTFQFSVPNGKDKEGNAMYRRTHWTSFRECAVQNGDFIELVGEIYEDKDQEGKRRDNHIVSMVSILRRDAQKREEAPSRYAEENDDNIPF